MTMEFESPIPGFVVWDALGHVRIVGYAVEGEIAGTKVIQIGIPGPERGTFAARQNVSPGSLYQVTAIDEERARQMNGLDRAPLLASGTVHVRFTDEYAGRTTPPLDLRDAQDGDEADDDDEDEDETDSYDASFVR